MVNSEIVSLVLRGPLTESIHRGHIVVMSSSGEQINSLGNPLLKTYARSTAKLLQAIAVIESGAAKHSGFTDQEIALLCASHSGEPHHVETVTAMLHKLNMEESFLQCGPHMPFDKTAAAKLRQHNEAPSQLHNNCSGKHTGMLALAKFMNSSTDAYMSPNHPVQQAMLQIVSEMSEYPVSDIALGVDGCGVPVFGMPIDRLALAFSKLAAFDSLEGPRAQACKRIITSIQRHPQFLAGTGRFDTRLIEVTGGRIIGKMGAEGIFALSVIQRERRLGMVVKIEDGAARALYPTVVEALKQLNLLSESELAELKPFHYPPIKNWRGDEVGFIQPAFQLG